VEPPLTRGELAEGERFERSGPRRATLVTDPADAGQSACRRASNVRTRAAWESRVMRSRSSTTIASP
jgi:hypothetical protein